MTGDEHGGQGDLAPVIPLFGGRMQRASDLPSGRGAEARGTVRFAPTDELDQTGDAATDDADAMPAVDPDAARQRAEEALLRRLRARSLSISEARQLLRGYEISAEAVDGVIDDFCRRRYLDDEELARQLVMSGHERKGQGRVALGRTLAQRGIARDAIDAVLAELPDDDFERALEFARGKARAMSRLDQETATRRLSGQLARRGYSGSLVSTAVRQALQEQGLGKTSGVRFE